MSFMPMKENSHYFLEVQDLRVYFPIYQSLLGDLFRRKKEYIHAVDGVSFSVRRGETFAVVGESGSGKTTLGRTLTLMVKPISGKIFLNGNNILEYSAKEAKTIVRSKIQMIFQDPFSSLNPRKTVRHAIEVPLKVQNKKRRVDIEGKIVELLKLTGLHESTRYKYPHELSGGQRQRVVIARALAANPELLIADEPVSKLDLSIKAQIINLFCDLREKMGLTMMFIAHDLRMAKHIGHTIAVMYHGHIMEVAPSRKLFQNTIHPYTKALLDAIPTLNPEHRKSHDRKELRVQDISLINPPLGCRYFKCCPIAREGCQNSPVSLRQVEEDHWVACHIYS